MRRVTPTYGYRPASAGSEPHGAMVVEDALMEPAVGTMSPGTLDELNHELSEAQVPTTAFDQSSA